MGLSSRHGFKVSRACRCSCVASRIFIKILENEELFGGAAASVVVEICTGEGTSKIRNNSLRSHQQS